MKIPAAGVKRETRIRKPQAFDHPMPCISDPQASSCCQDLLDRMVPHCPCVRRGGGITLEWGPWQTAAAAAVVAAPVPVGGSGGGGGVVGGGSDGGGGGDGGDGGVGAGSCGSTYKQ